MRWTILAFVLALVGCTDRASLVVVDVTADMPLTGIAAFDTHVTAGGRDAVFAVDAPAGTFSLDGSSQTFGIQIPKGMIGSIHVAIDAVDASGTTLASGAGDAAIKAGARVDVPIELAVTVASTSTPDLADVPAADMAVPAVAARLASDRTTQEFGNVTVNKTSNSVTIQISNSGELATGALMFQMTGANLDQFSITNGCAGTLAPGESCSVAAQFKPTSSGDKTAHFDVSATPGGTVGVDLSGTGTPPGTLSIVADAPYNGDCGSAVVGQTSSTFATYTVTNVGTSTTGAMTVSTGDPQFIATGCSGSLDPGKSCGITVHVKPSVAGMITSSVQVIATPGGTAPANVKGQGLKPAALKVTSSTGSFSFGTAQRNSAGNVITVTATNMGDVATGSLANPSFVGADAASFLVTTSTCGGQTIAPGASCTVNTEFKPLKSGPLMATLQLSDASGVLGSAGVTGTGTPLWQKETLPIPSGATTVPALTAIFGVAGDGSHVYAAGGASFYVRDATGTWNEYAINPTGFTPSTIWQGCAVGVNSAFLASDVGILRSTVPSSWANQEETSSVEALVAFAATDGWSAHNTGSGMLQLLRLTASGWAMDVAQTGYGPSSALPLALWGSSDGDVWLGGGANVSSLSTPVVWHRDASGTWTQQSVAAGCKNCPGGASPAVAALFGFGTPATVLFANVRPVMPLVYSGGTWSALANLPLAMTGSGRSCPGIWGASPTAVWFACDSGMFLYTGAGAWDANSQLNVSGFSAVWGASSLDVYAAGSDSSGAGLVYHYY